MGSGNLHCGSDSQYITLPLKKLVLLTGFPGKPIQITYPIVLWTPERVLERGQFTIGTALCTADESMPTS